MCNPHSGEVAFADLDACVRLTELAHLEGGKELCMAIRCTLHEEVARGLHVAVEAVEAYLVDHILLRRVALLRVHELSCGEECHVVEVHLLIDIFVQLHHNVVARNTQELHVLVRIELVAVGRHRHRELCLRLLVAQLVTDELSDLISLERAETVSETLEDVL